MRINPRVLSSAAAIAITCAVTAAAYFYKSRSAELNEVMVFCKLQFNAYSCFDKLMSYVEAARKSVNVCMPGIQNPGVQGRLVRLMKKRNIKVRIFIDRTGWNDSNDFFMKELIDAGAEIRCKNDPLYHMKHKFCLVDDKVLMTGTLNWGNDRSSDHWNYVYITSKNELVAPVKREFDLMWNESSCNMGQECTELDTIPFNPLCACKEVSAITEPSFSIPEIVITESIQDLNQSFRENVTTPEVCIA